MTSFEEAFKSLKATANRYENDAQFRAKMDEMVERAKREEAQRKRIERLDTFVRQTKCESYKKGIFMPMPGRFTERLIKNGGDLKRKSKLILSGKFGTGKTQAALAYAFHLGYFSATFINAQDLMKAYDGEENKYKDLYNSGIFILDDLGREGQRTAYSHTSAASVLYDVVNKCQERNIKLIITTNLGIDEFKPSNANSRYDQATRERLAENSAFISAAKDTPNYRENA